MSLDEMIEHIEQLANSTNGEEYNRLLEMLKELRVYKSIGTVDEMMDKCI